MAEKKDLQDVLNDGIGSSPEQNVHLNIAIAIRANPDLYAFQFAAEGEMEDMRLEHNGVWTRETVSQTGDGATSEIGTPNGDDTYVHEVCLEHASGKTTDLGLETCRKIRACGACHEMLQVGKNLCGGCRRIRYCNKRCQRNHWRDSHKRNSCQLITTVRDSWAKAFLEYASIID